MHKDLADRSFLMRTTRVTNDADIEMRFKKSYEIQTILEVTGRENVPLSSYKSSATLMGMMSFGDCSWVGRGSISHLLGWRGGIDPPEGQMGGLGGGGSV
jgi:hypothetical protein